MSNLVIVAIPSQDDYVWKISSEKIPHLTILYLGDVLATPNVIKMVEFLEHAANTMLHPFWLSVSSRGTLGPDEADVVFFDGWELPEIKRFRSALLQDVNIRKAYDSADQHPEWLPHLTLGYPATPAKPDDRDYPGVREVTFDKVALWYGDYEGPEFQLKPEPFMEVSMSDVKSVGAGAVSEVLAHYGVKGMRWGVRRDSSPSAARVEQKGKKLKAKGGTHQPAHPDAIKAKQLHQTARKSGLHALSNQELQDLQTRMNLEQNVARLSSQQSKSGPKIGSQSPAKKFVANLLVNTGNQQLQRIVNEKATQQVDKMMKEKKSKK